MKAVLDKLLNSKNFLVIFGILILCIMLVQVNLLKDRNSELKFYKNAFNEVIKKQFYQLANDSYKAKNLIEENINKEYLTKEEMGALKESVEGLFMTIEDISEMVELKKQGDSFPIRDLRNQRKLYSLKKEGDKYILDENTKRYMKDVLDLCNKVIESKAETFDLEEENLVKEDKWLEIYRSLYK